jgi:antirestriction protein ArdC
MDKKFDIYEVVTQRIIDLLEKGEIPWQQPWKTAKGFPMNMVSKRPYNGINFLLLLSSKFAEPYWLTYMQARELGGNIKKGEKSTMVVFWKLLDGRDSSGQLRVNSKGSIEKVPFLKYYNVFNIAQTEGIDPQKIPVTAAHDHDFDSIAIAEEIIYNWKDCPKIVQGADSAYYAPHLDTVYIPNPRTFLKDEFYYSVLYHELTHSVGHKSRLNRHEKITDHKFNSRDNSQEELVAELGAAFLCAASGIEGETLHNNAAYIKSWIRKFKDDPKVLVIAASQAQKAADYILGKLPDQSIPEPEILTEEEAR